MMQDNSHCNCRASTFLNQSGLYLYTVQFLKLGFLIMKETPAFYTRLGNKKQKTRKSFSSSDERFVFISIFAFCFISKHFHRLLAVCQKVGQMTFVFSHVLFTLTGGIVGRDQRIIFVMMFVCRFFSGEDSVLELFLLCICGAQTSSFISQ